MKTLLRAAVILAALDCLAAETAAGQLADTTRYEIWFPNASRHEAEIRVTYTGLPPQPLELRMSRSSPGRYALHEFAKNVYNVRAEDGDGRALTLLRPDPHQWDVHNHNGTVRVSYTLFGDHADGTYTGIDVTHAHMNMPATFMWARNTADRPIAITFRIPESSGWNVATQLIPTSDPMRYAAPHLQYFLDSPTELSAFESREWDVQGGAQRIRIAMHHLGTSSQLDEYAAHTRRIVEEQAAVFGELPEFDFGVYTFIADYLPWVRGDGMEHRNSTILTNTGSLSNMVGLLGTVAHEFFHAWNVERMRPASLEPFDFEQANMSGDLWFAEGFTSYYGPLSLRRAEVYDDARYASALSGAINTVSNAPGRRFFTPVEMSLQAPFVDAATSVDAQNRANTFISYYTWGAGIGLALDLTIRARYPDLTLDDFMRVMWREYGVHQENLTPQRPFTHDDLRVTLGEMLDDTAFASDFFRRYITGRDAPDYATLLAPAGILVRKARQGSATIGAPRLDVQNGGVVVMGPVLAGTALYDAGVSLGDRLVALNGREVETVDAVTSFVAALRPGDSIAIMFEQRGVRRTQNVHTGEDPTLEVVLYEDAGMELTETMRQFRAAWLNPKAR
ncbi:MAG: M61 family metallopeptidase [Gemmatimonadetes bacterium]|nr:M61 family metallopeptidase [Gemmatimonadota bacterium]